MNAAFRAKRKTSANGEARGEEKGKALFFSSPLFALREKMPRSPRLAHKAPVMQATEL